MSKVYHWSASDDGSSFYRSQGIFPYIKHKQLQFKDVSHLTISSWATILEDCDILFLQRPWSQDHVSAIWGARALGIRVIIDYDDDFTGIPKHNPAHYHYRMHMDNCLKCVRMSDEVWVSTTGVKNSLNKYNKNIHIIPNAHNDFLYKVENKLNNNPHNKTVFYRGGSTHRMDLFEYAHQICKVALKNESWRFHMLGVDDNWEFQRIAWENNNISVANKIPIIQYFRHIYELNSSMAICPLLDNQLNRSKSNISWIEATYCGSAFIGKKILPEFNHDFIFDIDHLDMFEEYSNPSRMKRYNEESWQYILDNLLLSKINLLRIERLLAK
jgi:hypothetical protein